MESRFSELQFLPVQLDPAFPEIDWEVPRYPLKACLIAHLLSLGDRRRQISRV
jgi:hypothetical protein